MDDCFSRPVTGVPGRTITLIDRVSDDFSLNFRPTGTLTRALNVSSYNYLGFAQATGGCADAVETSIHKYGMSATGSRLESGNLDLHVQAEALVARFVGQEASVINSMGFATNSTTLPAIAGRGSLIISDEYNHASIRFGVRISGASVRMFKHNDVADLEKLLREVVSQGQPKTHRPWKRIIVVVEGLYSMEGTMPDLPALIELKRKYKVCIISYFLAEAQPCSFHSSISMSTRRIPLEHWAPTDVVSATTSVSIPKTLTFLWVPLPNHLAPPEAIYPVPKRSLTVSASVPMPVPMQRLCPPAS